MKYFIFSLFFLILLVPHAARAQGADVQVTLYNEVGTTLSSFFPFGEDYRGEGSIDAADLGDDGVPELIIGSGPGLAPMVKLYRQDGSLINEFLAYGEAYQNGLNATACDVDKDGMQEIVTGTMLGGGPHVRIFETDGTVLYDGGFFAYSDAFRGGVNVACGDVDGDGAEDIITGAGLTGGPHIKVFTPGGDMKYEIFAGSAFEDTGTTVAAGDLTGDGTAEIIAGRMGIGDSSVTVFDLRGDHLSFVIAMQTFEDYKNGIRVTSGDVDGDGTDEIGVATTRHQNAQVKFFELTGNTVAHIAPFEETLERGIVASTVKNGGKDHVLVMSSTPRDSNMIGKYIHVDVSEQKLYAYENGVLVNSFLVSTGVYAFPTPLGTTQITDKLLWHDYIWSYGPDNPNNYSLPDVKYNLRFRPHYYIHSAYWHNNFGHRMSHGCVNVSLANAEWVYNWAQVGTTVEVTN